ncbi:hypothetical protein Agau_L300573 [Agrobacterium tumefaciens F2]|nr:hypothetical protein Agau_L300573 [Agrobacterium tumefaciens F2]
MKGESHGVPSRRCHPHADKGPVSRPLRMLVMLLRYKIRISIMRRVHVNRRGRRTAENLEVCIGDARKSWGFRVRPQTRRHPRA